MTQRDAHRVLAVAALLLAAAVSGTAVAGAHAGGPDNDLLSVPADKIPYLVAAQPLPPPPADAPQPHPPVLPVVPHQTMPNEGVIVDSGGETIDFPARDFVSVNEYRISRGDADVVIHAGRNEQTGLAEVRVDVFRLGEHDSAQVPLPGLSGPARLTSVDATTIVAADLAGAARSIPLATLDLPHLPPPGA